MQKRLSTTIDELLSDEIDIALRARAKAILQHLDIKKGDHILDAGCGWGYYLKLVSSLSTHNFKLVGIDNHKQSIDKARVAVKNKNLKLLVGDITHMPFKANTFDKVILSEVAEHLENDEAAFKEIYRVLKPGGFLLITVPNANYPLFWDPVNWFLENFFNTHVKTGFWAGIWTNHKRLYKPADLSIKLTKNKYKIEIIRSLTLLCLPFNKNLLYGGKLPPSVSKKLIKQIRSSQKPVYVRILLYFVNMNAKLNDQFKSKDVGVSVFVKAIK